MQLVYDAVFSRFSQLSTNLSTFPEMLVVLHSAYAELQPQLQQFQQLVSLSPKIVLYVFKKLNEDIDLKNEISVSISLLLTSYVINCYICKYKIFCIITISNAYHSNN